MFLEMYTLRQTFRCVIRLYRYYRLYDQRPAIEFLGDEMHTAAMLAVASFQGALVSVQAFVPG